MSHPESAPNASLNSVSNGVAAPHAVAEAFLAGIEPVFARLIAQYGPCQLVTSDNHFSVLVTMIIGQQISTAAARTIARRVVEMVQPQELTPSRFAELSEESWRACGLSSPKRRTLRNVLDHLGQQPDFFERLADPAMASQRETMLRTIRGIGPWTAQMMEIFAFGHSDVWPLGDLGLQLAFRDQFQLPEVPDPATLEQRSIPWRPYRTLATWYLWRSRGFIPQSNLE